MAKRLDLTDRAAAIATLARVGIYPSADFYALRSSQVCSLLEEADAARYRKPKSANGSRARYFYARLQRLANKT